MTIQHYIIITIIFCLLITGCNTQTTSNKPASLNTQKPHTCSERKTPFQKAPVPVGFLEVSSVEPAKYEKLTLGEKLNIEAAYDLESLDNAMIWARPYLNGSRARGYSAHHLTSVNKKNGNPGIVECWFYFDKPAKIDEVRVFMQDQVSGKIVKEISYKIDAEWTAAEAGR